VSERVERARAFWEVAHVDPCPDTGPASYCGREFGDGLCIHDLAAFAAAEVAAEREACAKVADEEVAGANTVLAIPDLTRQARREAEAWLAPAKSIAKVIRARASMEAKGHE
jgi:hypothetical protein